MPSGVGLWLLPFDRQKQREQKATFPNCYAQDNPIILSAYATYRIMLTQWSWIYPAFCFLPMVTAMPKLFRIILSGFPCMFKHLSFDRYRMAWGCLENIPTRLWQLLTFIELFTE